MVYFSRFAREDIYMACFTLLLVVSVARYVRDRKMRWLVLAALAFAFSYATKEATFLTIAVFGSFIGALVVWELGLTMVDSRERRSERLLRGIFSRLLLLSFCCSISIVLGLVGKVFLWLVQSALYLCHRSEKYHSLRSLCPGIEG